MLSSSSTIGLIMRICTIFAISSVVCPSSLAFSPIMPITANKLTVTSTSSTTSLQASSSYRNLSLGSSFSITPNSDKHSNPIIISRRNFFIATVATSFLPPTIANAATTDKNTGIVLPSEGEIENAIPPVWDDDDNPFTTGSRDMFSRLDSTSDSVFYSDPRFVEHVDDNAVTLMTNYISQNVLNHQDSVLDLCSSWTSHFDVSTKNKLNLKRVAGLGMNPKELAMNPVLTDWTVQDLNAVSSPKLPYEDSSFDVVLCQLSIDYLIHPLEVMKEVGRVLRPGGRVVILFSNRLFLSKAVGLWTGADDIDHAYTVVAYLHYCNGGFENIKAVDLSTRKGRGKNRSIVGDPLYAVTATRSAKEMSV